MVGSNVFGTMGSMRGTVPCSVSLIAPWGGVWCNLVFLCSGAAHEDSAEQLGVSRLLAETMGLQVSPAIALWAWYFLAGIVLEPAFVSG